MKRDLEALERAPFDLAVIGGGIFGVCAAWDAAQRGLSVAIIERGDFGGATSANSFKIVHGGVRYVQHGDIYRIRQSSSERRVLLGIAPHLVRPLPIVIPTYGYAMKSKWALRVGLGAYDLVTADRNRGITDPSRHIPWSAFLHRDEVLRSFSGLDHRGLTGAAVFADGQLLNPPRLVLAFLQRAVQSGAVAANYVQASDLLRRGNRVVGVRARDEVTGSELAIRARVVLNAAGPLAERLLNGEADMRITPPGSYSRDACFVVGRRLLQGEAALAVQGRTRDPDAVLSRGERHLFIAPWREYTLVGTWHKVFRGDPEQIHVTNDELEAFLDEINAAYAALDLSLDDISLCCAGLVPFGDNAAGAEHLRYGHRSRLIDHAKLHGIDNFITLIGVRFTVGRWDAVRAVDLACAKLGRKTPRSRTSVTPVFGGHIWNMDDYLRDATARARGILPAEVVSCLVHHHGDAHGILVMLARMEPALARQIGASSIIGAQVVHAARHEMAQTLGDVVFRRTDLATGTYPGRAALDECARLMQPELGWSAERAQREIDQVTARFPARAVDRVDRREGTGPNRSPARRGEKASTRGGLLLTAAIAALLSTACHTDTLGGTAPYPQSPIILGATFDDASIRTAAPGSDNWPITWAADDRLYTSFGDGGGFGGTDREGRVSLGVARVEGGKENYEGLNIAGGKDAPHPPPFAGKSEGIVAVGNTLYLWRAGDGSGTDAFRFSSLYRSDDSGATWRDTGVKFSKAAADFPANDEGFFSPTFCQFGKGYQDRRDDFLYTYAPEISDPSHWKVQQPGRIALVRVPLDAIETKTAYRFFAGIGADGAPVWTADIGQRQAIWEDPVGGAHRMAVSYNAGLDRYLLTTMTVDRQGTIGIYDAAEPWGPWTTVLVQRNPKRWGRKVVAFNFVNKWMSAGGQHFVIVYTQNDRWATIHGSFRTHPLHSQKK